MAYIDHLKQLGKRPLTAAEVGGPEEGDIEMFNGEDPTAAFSHAFEDALGRNVERYRQSPVMTRRNIDALEDARSEGFIADDPLARRGRRAQFEDELAIEEAKAAGRIGVAELQSGARRYEADARRDVATTAAEGRTGSARVQGLMRQLEELRGQRGGLRPATSEQAGTGMRGWLGFGPGKAAVPAARNDQDRINYLDTQAGDLQRQLGDEGVSVFSWDQVREAAAEIGTTPEDVEQQLRARGHVVYR